MTPKQERFVAEYLIDLNATQAAIRAGYSAKTAYVIGHENLSKPEIAAAVSERRQRIAAKLEVTQESVTAELAKIGFSDIRRLFNESGSLKRIEDLDDHAAGCLASVEVVTRKVPGSDDNEVEHTAKLKLWDKRAALVDLGKHLGMFKEQSVVDVNVHADISDAELARLTVFLLTKAEREARPTTH